MSTPWLTIITATFNRAALLREAIASVTAQGESGVEHVIVDAVSTDGTRELLAGLPHLRVLSEPDRGIYDAFNKGLRMATGEFVHFLNSDDLLAPGALRATRQSLAQQPTDVLTGGVEFFRRAGEGEEVFRCETRPELLELSFRGVLAGMPAINGRIFRLEFLRPLGEFSLDYSVAADRDFLLRAARARPRCSFLPEVIYRYRCHEGSLTVQHEPPGMDRIRREHLTLAERHLADGGTPAERRELAAFHTRESAALAVEALVHGDLAEARRCAARGCRVSVSWPFVALKRLGGRALGRRSDALAG